MPPKNIHEIFIPQKIFIFWNPPKIVVNNKNIEIQYLEPKKWSKPTYVWKYQNTHRPPTHPLLTPRNAIFVTCTKILCPGMDELSSF